MKLNEFMTLSSIYLEVDVDSKKALFKEIGKIAEKKIKVESVKIIEKLNKREMLGSTGVGQGAAIPHTKIEGISKTIVLFLKLKNSIDFSSPDKRNVDLIFAIITPEDTQSEHLLILSSISNFLKKDGNLEKLRSLNDANNTMKIFSKY